MKETEEGTPKPKYTSFYWDADAGELGAYMEEYADYDIFKIILANNEKVEDGYCRECYRIFLIKKSSNQKLEPF